VVENKAGGATIIGTDTVAKAKPDGYTLLLATGALAVNAAFDMPLPYDTYKDLTPVVHFFDVPILVAASNEAPFKSMAELVAKAKSEPVSYASASGGSMQHLWAELIRMRFGMKLENVGYKARSQAVRSLLDSNLPIVDDLMVPTGAA
jgi:tripartite-type tricarboxylate transporter receptor subunit TctC